MRIEAISNTGNFNLLNLEEEIILTRITIFGQDDKVIQSTCIKTEYHYNENDPEEIVDMIDQFLMKMLITTQKEGLLSLKEFIQGHEYELALGNYKFRLENINTSLSQLIHEKKDIENSIEYLIANKEEYIKKENK